MNIEKCNILWSFAFWSSAKLSWIINNITRMHTTSPYPPKWFCRTDHLFMCFFLVIVLLWFSYRALIVQKNEDLRRNLDLVQEISALFRCGKRLVIHQNESYDLLSLLALLLSGGSFSHLTPFNNLCCSGQNVFSALVVHTIFMVPLQVSSGFYLFFFSALILSMKMLFGCFPSLAWKMSSEADMMTASNCSHSSGCCCCHVARCCFFFSQCCSKCGFTSIYITFLAYSKKNRRFPAGF